MSLVLWRNCYAQNWGKANTWPSIETQIGMGKLLVSPHLPPWYGLYKPTMIKSFSFTVYNIWNAQNWAQLWRLLLASSTHVLVLQKQTQLGNLKRMQRNCKGLLQMSMMSVHNLGYCAMDLCWTFTLSWHCAYICIYIYIHITDSI